MPGFVCTTCGLFHEELPMCLGPAAPALWYSIPEAERRKRCELSSDQCIVDNEHFFIVGRIVIPVIDGPSPFVWLAWVSLSEQNFLRASELWHSPGRESEAPYFGWLQSLLPYEPSTLNLKTSVHTMPVGERPLIELEPTGHPLAVEQRDGIRMSRVQEIIEGALHG